MYMYMYYTNIIIIYLILTLLQWTGATPELRLYTRAMIYISMIFSFVFIIEVGA